MASLSLPLLPTLLFLTFLCYSEADLINDICSEAVNPSLCFGTFQSDPRSAGADLGGLGQIIIEKSTAATNDVIAVAKSFPGGAADVCMQTLGSTIDDLGKCSYYLKDCSVGGCKADLRTRASGAHSNVITCEDSYTEIGAEPAQLRTAAKRAEDLISVLLDIASRW